MSSTAISALRLAKEAPILSANNHRTNHSCFVRIKRIVRLGKMRVF